MLEGLMQHDHPLTLQHVLGRMRGMNGDAEVVTLSDDGDIVTLSPHIHGPGPRPMYVYRRDATNTWLHQANIGDPVYFEQALELGIQHHEAAAYYDRSEHE